ncbi:MAG: MotA/TolQ/ExbB proton channel family protein [Oligoflexia bacterium]|nr:MotA/TolQ/ExbB proton channel family protein [Oligoflexia bacterium]
MFIFSNITEAFRVGGIWMWAILAAQIVSIAIIAERVFALYITRNTGQKALAASFEDDIRKGNIEKVLTRARALRFTNPIAQVVEAGAQAAIDMGGRDEIQAKMDEVLLHENARLEKRTGFLAMIGNVGTLLGLLGTIVGLIESFSSVGNANPIEKAALLSQGISMAMHATAYGLLMAIPAIVMYSVLQNRAQALAEDINQGALKVFNWLSFNYESVPAKRIRSKEAK